MSNTKCGTWLGYKACERPGEKGTPWCFLHPGGKMMRGVAPREVRGLRDYLKPETLWEPTGSLIREPITCSLCGYSGNEGTAPCPVFTWGTKRCDKHQGLLSADGPDWQLYESMKGTDMTVGSTSGVAVIKSNYEAAGDPHHVISHTISGFSPSAFAHMLAVSSPRIEESEAYAFKFAAMIYSDQNFNKASWEAEYEPGHYGNTDFVLHPPELGTEFVDSLTDATSDDVMDWADNQIDVSLSDAVLVEYSTDDLEGQVKPAVCEEGTPDIALDVPLGVIRRANGTSLIAYGNSNLETLMGIAAATGESQKFLMYTTLDNLAY